MVTEIYLENYPAFSTPCRSLMCTILSNRAAYYEHKVSTHVKAIFDRLCGEFEFEIIHNFLFVVG